MRIVIEKLTECEQLIMKVVWDASEELSLMEIMQRANDKYHKEWKPQTVSTFLARLVSKGYLESYRQGRLFFYRIMVPLEEYTGQQAKEFVEFWHHDRADEFLRTLMMSRALSGSETDRIRRMVVEGWGCQSRCDGRIY